MLKPNIPFNEFLADLRNELRIRNITQAEVAKWLKVEQATVSRLIAGIHPFPLQYLEIILRRSGIAENRKFYKNLRNILI